MSLLDDCIEEAGDYYTGIEDKDLSEHFYYYLGAFNALKLVVEGGAKIDDHPINYLRQQMRKGAAALANEALESDEQWFPVQEAILHDLSNNK